MLELMPAWSHACDLLRLMALWVQMSAVVDSTAKRLETTPFQVPGLTFTLEQFIAKQGFSRSPAEVSSGPAMIESCVAVYTPFFMQHGSSKDANCPLTHYELPVPSDP